jgi:hypothetical protein
MVDRATTLQSLMWPEVGLCTERELYFALSPDAAFSQKKHEIHFLSGGHANFGTYYNLFNIGKWHKHCGLTSLSLALEGEGRFELVVFIAMPNRSYERIFNEIVSIQANTPFSLPIHPLTSFDTRGVLFFELRALGV